MGKGYQGQQHGHQQSQQQSQRAELSTGASERAKAETPFDELSIILYPWDQTLERMARKWREENRVDPKIRFAKSLRVASLQQRGRIHLLIPDYYREFVELREPVLIAPHWREEVGPEELNSINVSTLVGALAKAALPFRVERQQFSDHDPGIVRISEC